MSLYQSDVVTLWVLRTDAPEMVAALFTTPYTEDGDAISIHERVPAAGVRRGLRRARHR